MKEHIYMLAIVKPTIIVSAITTKIPTRIAQTISLAVSDDELHPVVGSMNTHYVLRLSVVIWFCTTHLEIQTKESM